MCSSNNFPLKNIVAEALQSGLFSLNSAKTVRIFSIVLDGASSKVKAINFRVLSTSEVSTSSTFQTKEGEFEPLESVFSKGNIDSFEDKIFSLSKLSFLLSAAGLHAERNKKRQAGMSLSKF